MNDSFMKFVDQSAGADSCWPWTGFIDKKGQGRAFIYGQQRIARVAVFELLHGKKVGYRLRRVYSCIAASCCNPKHYAECTPIQSFWGMTAEGSVPDRDPKLGPCLIWTGTLFVDGYGRFRSQFAHRVAWEFTHGPIEDRKVIRHKCDNPPCVRPEHLEPGTQADNVADMIARGRHKRCGARGDVHWTVRRPDLVPKGSYRGQAKLTETEVLAIRNRVASGEEQKSLAEEFGINPATMHAIVHGYKWRHVGGPIPDYGGMARGTRHGMAKLNEVLVQRIRTDSRSQAQIALELGISQTLVSQVKRRLIWAHVE